MNPVKKFVKRNSHNILLKPLAGLGRSINRLYENRNHHAESNGEFTLLKKISSLYPKIIFDVGANVGEYAKLIHSACPSSIIYSFEPVQNTFRTLEDNLKSDIYKNIHRIKKGFYKENKTLPINIYPGHEHSSLFSIKGVGYSSIKQENIEVITGDRFMADNNIGQVDFIKMDLEGSEMDALVGLEKSLSEKRVRLIQFEYGYINITTKNLLADYYDFFAKHGYLVGKVYPKRVEFRKYEFKHEDFIGPNFVAAHQADAALIKLLSN